MSRETIEVLLTRWYLMLCESGNNTKTRVRKEIADVLKRLKEEEDQDEII